MYVKCLHILTVVLAVLSAGSLYAQTDEQIAIELDGVSVTERIGETIPLDFTFVDDNAKTVRLAQYFKSGRPVLITFNYSNCPRLCAQQLNDLARAFKELKLTPGEDFTVLTIGVDPDETFKRAKTSKLNKLAIIGDKRYDKNWHFLTTTQEADILTVASTMGYKYTWDEKDKAYRHKAALMIVNGDAVVSHYIRGAGYRADELELVLKQSAAGEMGEPSEDDTGFGLSCFVIEYTDAVGRAMTVMRIGGAVVVLFLFSFVGYFWFREFKRRPRLKEATQ
ncbi:SCO family protein [Planctomycetota bacterium]|nr:SCO family protein [Planctomycetota bacterium]